MTDNREISIKALVLGVLTDIGCSLIVGFALSPMVLVPSMIIGFGFTILGGFVAGRVSKKSEVIHGGIVGFIAVIGIVVRKASKSFYAICNRT